MTSAAKTRTPTAAAAAAAAVAVPDDAGDAAAAAKLAHDASAVSAGPLSAANRRELAEQGYTVVDIGFSADECAALVDRMWAFVTGLAPSIVRHDKSTYSAWPSHSHRILQHHGVGQAALSWDVRQDPRVVAVFEALWQVPAEQLLVSMDGMCLMPAGATTLAGADEAGETTLKKSWTHSDQSATKKGLHCVQGFVNLVSCEADGDGGLLVYPMSHLIHHQFLTRHCHATSKDDWFKFELDHLRTLQTDVRRFLPDDHQLRHSAEPVPLRPVRVRAAAGQLVLWDSRTFHRNVMPLSNSAAPSTKDRAVVYVCMLPRTKYDKLEALLLKRRAWLADRRTTNHWGSKAFPKVPRTYGKPTGALASVDAQLVRGPEQLTALGRTLAGFD